MDGRSVEDMLDDIVNSVLNAEVEDYLKSKSRSPSSAYLSESSQSFVEHALPLRGLEVPQPWSLPLPLDKSDMDPRKWRSEAQAAAEATAAAKSSTVIAGAKSQANVKAPSFFAWTFDDASDEVDGTQQRQTVFAPPFGVLEQDNNAAAWESEYSSSNVKMQVTSAPAVVAGAASAERDSPPPFFYWPVADRKAVRKSVPLITGTEHADRYSWPIDETSPTLIPLPPPVVKPPVVAASQGAPYGTSSDADSSPQKWRSEYTAKFRSAAGAVAFEEDLTAEVYGDEENDDDENDEDYEEEQEEEEAPAVVLPPPAPAQKAKKLTFTTEHRENFTWPRTEGVSAPSSAAVPVPASSGSKQREPRSLRMQTISQNSFKWPPRDVYSSASASAHVRRSTNSSDPQLLSHPIKAAAPSVGEFDALLFAAGGESGAISGGDSVAATAQATAADTISTGPAAADAASVPASSVTGPAGTPRAPSAQKKRQGLAVVGTKIPIPSSSAAAAAASGPALVKPSAAKKTQTAARRIANKIKSKAQRSNNPVLNNRRYPSNSDRQNNRWITEAKSAFSLRIPTKKALGL